MGQAQGWAAAAKVALAAKAATTGDGGGGCPQGFSHKEPTMA